VKIDTQALLTAVAILENVPSRTGIQSSEYVKLECAGDTLRLLLASDLVGAVSVPVTEPTPFSFFVERRLLFPFVNAAKGHDKPFTATYAGGCLTLKERKRSVKYQGVDAMKGYTDVSPSKEKTIKLEKAHLAELRLAARYASFDSLAPELSCVWMDEAGGAICATNKFSVFSSRVKVAGSGPIPFIFPDLLNEESKVKVSSEGARIVYPSGYLFQSFNEKALKNFPHKQITATIAAAEKWKLRLQLPAKKMVEALQRLALYVNGASSDETIIRVTAKAGDATLRFSTAAAQGHFSETITLSKAPTEAWEADWLHPSIRPFLEAADAKADLLVRWNDDSPFFFQDKAAKRFLISPRKATK